MAADVVLAVEQDGAFANLLLPRLLRERSLDARDAAFATEMAYGTLRYQGVLDLVIGAGARREAATLDPPVRAALRLGAYQVLRTRVAVHAAVSTTVQLARDLAGPKPAGLVNAVMRRVSERSWDEWADRFAPRTDQLGRIAFTHGYPRWVAQVLLDALGGDTTELEAALAEDRPVTHLVARPGRISRDDLLRQAGPGAVAGPWSPYAVRLESGGDPGRIEAVRSGDAGVQDEGSQLAAMALVGVEPSGAERRWLDVCAGPGGKAALLAGLLPPSVELLAADVQPHRARLVERVLRGSSSRVVVADGTRPAWRAADFDRVLVDAPCTGLGALRRRPEVRWRRVPEDADRLHGLQLHLLDAAVDSVRVGGLVAYVTCSPHPRETVDVVTETVNVRGDVETVDVRPLLPGLPDLGGGPHVQLWPHRHGTDAMFIALLRRR